MGVLLETSFPESLGAADVAKIALSASVLINHTRHKRFGNLVLERKERGKPSSRFENNLKIAERNIFLESFD